MPVDRSLLPPLPGKPEWYVEDAPRAMDPRIAGSVPLGADVGVPEPAPKPAATRAQSEPTTLPKRLPTGLPERPPERLPERLPERVPLAGPAFPTVANQPRPLRGIERVKALAGRFKHWRSFAA